MLSSSKDLLHSEQYQHLLIILLMIARLHPHHLALLPNSIQKTLEKALGKTSDPAPLYDESDGCGLWSDVVKQLNELFWLFYNQRPVNPVTSSVLSMGELY